MVCGLYCFAKIQKHLISETHLDTRVSGKNLWACGPAALGGKVLCIAYVLRLTKVLIYTDWGFDGSDFSLVEKSDIYLTSEQPTSLKHKERECFSEERQFLLVTLNENYIGSTLAIVFLGNPEYQDGT